jgi:hypothetical protein
MLVLTVKRGVYQMKQQVYYLNKDDKAQLFEYLTWLIRQYELLPSNDSLRLCITQDLINDFKVLTVNDLKYPQWHQIQLLAAFLDKANYKTVMNSIKPKVVFNTSETNEQYYNSVKSYNIRQASYYQNHAKASH